MPVIPALLLGYSLCPNVVLPLPRDAPAITPPLRHRLPATMPVGNSCSCKYSLCHNDARSPACHPFHCWSSRGGSCPPCHPFHCWSTLKSGSGWWVVPPPYRSWVAGGCTHGSRVACTLSRVHHAAHVRVVEHRSTLHPEEQSSAKDRAILYRPDPPRGILLLSLVTVLRQLLRAREEREWSRTGVNWIGTGQSGL